MPTLDLSSADLETVRRILAKYAPGAETWAYGSRVTGGSHEGSDLDLALRSPTDSAASQVDLYRLREAFSESDLTMLVDVLDWARIPDSFRSNIERSHVVVRAVSNHDDGDTRSPGCHSHSRI